MPTPPLPPPSDLESSATAVASTGRWTDLAHRPPEFQWKVWREVAKHHPGQLPSAEQMVRWPSLWPLCRSIVQNAVGRQDETMLEEWMEAFLTFSPLRLAQQASAINDWSSHIAKHWPCSKALAWYEVTWNKKWCDSDVRGALEMGFARGALCAKDPSVWKEWTQQKSKQSQADLAQRVVQEWVDNFTDLSERAWRRKQGHDEKPFVLSVPMIQTFHQHGTLHQQRAIEQVLWRFMRSYPSPAECTKAGALLLRLTDENLMLQLLEQTQEGFFSLSTEFMVLLLKKHPTSSIMEVVERKYHMLLQRNHHALKEALFQAQKRELERITEVHKQPTSPSHRKL